MTSKERAALRSKANPLEAIFQIGKGGINDNLIAQIDDVLQVRDLIKVRVLLETSPEDPRALAHKLAKATNSEVVQVIGGIIVLYREITEQRKKEKPKKDKKPARKGKVVRGLRQRNDDREAFYEKRKSFKKSNKRY